MSYDAEQYEEDMDWIRENHKELMKEFIDAIKRGDKEEIETVKNWLTKEDMLEWGSETNEYGKSKDEFIRGIINDDKFCIDLLEICFDYDHMYDWCELNGVFRNLSYARSMNGG